MFACLGSFSLLYTFTVWQNRSHQSLLCAILTVLHLSLPLFPPFSLTTRNTCAIEILISPTLSPRFNKGEGENRNTRMCVLWRTKHTYVCTYSKSKTVMCTVRTNYIAQLLHPFSVIFRLVFTVVLGRILCLFPGCLFYCLKIFLVGP